MNRNERPLDWIRHKSPNYGTVPSGVSSPEQLQHAAATALVGGNFSDSGARRVCSKVKQAFIVLEQFLAAPIKPPGKFIVVPHGAGIQSAL
jgi:hypothetical protein